MYKSKDTRTILWNLATGENKAVFQGPSRRRIQSRWKALASHLHGLKN